MSSPMYDIPEHFPMPFNKAGEGPVPADEAYGWECWCRDGAKCKVFDQALTTIDWDKL